METDFWNIKHDWRELDQDAAVLFLLDACFSLISCNRFSQKNLLTHCFRKIITFSINCFWSPKIQDIFLDNIENHKTNSHFLLSELNAILKEGENKSTND